MTSLSMALNFAGVSNDPGSLNQFMKETDNDYNGTAVNWGAATRDRSNGGLRFDAFRPRSTEALDAALCEGRPVIVGVNLNSSGVPGHFVVVTGKQGNQYLIADPGFAGRTTLDSYNNQFETRGSVVPVEAGNGSSLNAFRLGPAACRLRMSASSTLPLMAMQSCRLQTRREPHRTTQHHGNDC